MYNEYLRRDDGHEHALEFELKGKRNKVKTTKEDVEDKSGEGEQEWSVGLEKVDAMN